MNPRTVFADILANWPQMFIIFTKGPDARACRTHVHRAPHDPDRFALVRINDGDIIGIAQITRSELEALAQLID